MRRPRRAVFAVGILVPLLVAAAAPHPDLGLAIRARLDAYAKRDAPAWAAFVDERCVCAAETKATILRAIANRPPTVENWYGEITDLELSEFGDTAIARYRVTEFTTVDGRRNQLDEWRLETHVLRGGAWILVAAAESPIAADPAEVEVPAALLARYAGRYEYTAGSIDVITIEGDHLVLESAGEPKVELAAESATTFFAKGQPYRLIFQTGENGAVDAVVFRQLGQEYTGKRVP